MTTLKVHNIETAPAESKPLIRRILKKLTE